MKRNIIKPQMSDMGNGYGEYLFPKGTTLGEFLEWYKKNSETCGEVSITYIGGDVLRKFDYDLYNNDIFYTHFSWQNQLPIKKIEFYYCFMSKDVFIRLDK